MGTPTWSNHAVTGDISWPKKRAVFQFGEYEIVALPSSPKTEASLHIDLVKHKLDGIEAMSIFNRVLSMATWIDDQAAVLENGWSGNRGPEPPSIPRNSRSYPTSILDDWIFLREPPSDERVRKAIAIYREARNLERHHSLPYAALGYYKLLEIKFGGGHTRAAWLEKAIAQIWSTQPFLDDTRLKDFKEAIGDTPRKISTALREQGRNAVAHAHFESSVNPDDIKQVRVLSLALRAFRPVARFFIRTELGFSDGRWGE